MSEDICLNCGYSLKTHVKRDLEGIGSHKICKKFKMKEENEFEDLTEEEIKEEMKFQKELEKAGI